MTRRVKKSDPAALGILSTVLSPARAQDVLDHREMIGAPMTRRAAVLLVGKFAEAPDADAAADTMIARNWQGFDVRWGQQPVVRNERTPAESTLDRRKRQLAERITK